MELGQFRITEDLFLCLMKRGIFQSTQWWSFKPCQACSFLFQNDWRSGILVARAISTSRQISGALLSCKLLKLCLLSRCLLSDFYFSIMHAIISTLTWACLLLLPLLTSGKTQKPMKAGAVGCLAAILWNSCCAEEAMHVNIATEELRTSPRTY